MTPVKIKWRKSPHTDDLNDCEKGRFYSYRHHIVRAIQSQNMNAMNKNKLRAETDEGSEVESHCPLLELNESEIDRLAREAYDLDSMPILHNDEIVLAPKVTRDAIGV